VSVARMSEARSGPNGMALERYTVSGACHRVATRLGGLFILVGVAAASRSFPMGRHF
jgi:hypothetical protein